MRITKQKKLILQTLCENVVHPTADYIYEIAKKQMPSISLATVYRNLKALSDEGIIKKIEGLDGTMHFDHKTCNHHHFICNICNSVYDVPTQLTFKPDAKKFKAIGLYLTEFDISLKGMCQNCKNQKEKKQ